MNTGYRFDTLTTLGPVSVEAFLRDYWQQKPLFVKGAFADFAPLISAEEIAGLALESSVRSRLVIENPERATWQVEHGPLDDAIFAKLPPRCWSLLIQNADSLDPRLSGLLQAFRFLPNWRIEDLMVSYAADGGGVGPHFDYYDVFLVQGSGTRRWRLGQRCTSESPLVEDCPMKLLREFHTEQEVLAEPGDLLYVPAGCAHWGIAAGDCSTYSVGFRAPSHSDFLLDFSADVAANLSPDKRYRDPLNQLTASPSKAAHSRTSNGLIQAQAIEEFSQLLRGLANDHEAIGRWLAKAGTELHQAVDELYPAASLTELREDTPVYLSPQCRCAYLQEGTACLCYVNGSGMACSESLAVLLSQYQLIQFSQFALSDQVMLEQLALDGLLVRGDPYDNEGRPL